jgi:long-chain acyl-CoA synthetase
MAYTRLFDLLGHCLEKFPKEDALASKVNGKWVTYSTQAYSDFSTSLAHGFLKLGINPGDKAGIISNNRPEWNFTDMACLMTGVINVPIYPTISDQDLEFIISDAEISYFFVSGKDLYQKVKRCSAKNGLLKKIYCFDPVDEASHWSEILRLGESHPDTPRLEQIKSSVNPGSLATILYTSGTTGNPKGVMLSHNNLVSQLLAVKHLMPVDHRHRALSFLPLNHVYERMLTYNYFACGTSIYYAESMDTITANLQEIKPHIFTTVPRLLEKVYDRIVSRGAELSGFKKKLFNWALELGLRYEMDGKNGISYELQLKLARKLIFSKWKEALGGELLTTVSGGAALQDRLARVFWAAGIPVLQGYGLTETSPVIAVNYLDPGCNRFGTVGPLLDRVEIRIAEDGEILVKGPNVMLGYYKNPEATAEAITDGWFHTGDIGLLEDGKFLKITDRKKEIFKTSGGKYITPGRIENRLRESPYIEQAMVVGENQKFASALIVPAFAYLKEVCMKNGIQYTNNTEMIKNDFVRSRIKEEVEKVNNNLAHYETLKRFELIPQEWTIEAGELTPKLSLKRKVILTLFRSLVDKIYAADVH